MSVTSKQRMTGAAPSSHGDKSDYQNNPSGIVMGLTLNMAWQLAIAVLLPLLGGHVLDGHLGSSPLWTLIGLVVAMALMIVIVRRTLLQLNASMHLPDVHDTEPKDGKDV